MIAFLLFLVGDGIPLQFLVGDGIPPHFWFEATFSHFFRQVARIGCLWPGVMAGAKGQHAGKQE